MASVWLSSFPIEVLISSLSQIAHQCHPMPKRHAAHTHSASITNTGDTTNSTPATLESLDLRGSSPFYYPFLWIWRMKIQDNKKDMWHQPHPLPCATFLSRSGCSTRQTCSNSWKDFLRTRSLVHFRKGGSSLHGSRVVRKAQHIHIYRWYKYIHCMLHKTCVYVVYDVQPCTENYGGHNQGFVQPENLSTSLRSGV